MKDLLKEKIELEYKNLLDLDLIVKNKSKEVENSKNSILSSEEDDIEKISKLYSDKYVDLVLFGKDLRVLFERVHVYISLFKELGYSGLSEDIINFYNQSSNNAPKQIFYIKDGNLLEKEEGSLQKERELFMNSDFMKSIQDNK